ncbi:MAG: TIR domain-containing protein [Anaerolineae bacterium]
MSDIFISYARENSEFVRQLVEALRADKREVWIDFDDIPFGTNWWEEIVKGIENMTAGIFIISRDSIQSQYCSLEVAQMIKHQKRIIPIVYEAPEDLIDRLPQAIRDLNWVRFDSEENFDSAYQGLLTTIDTDYEAARQHTQLLVKALEWQQRGHTKDSLIRGDELASFLPMLERQDLTPIQQAFLDESLLAARARYNFWRFVFGFFGGLLAMAFYIAMAFRATSITPALVTTIIAAGEVFGLFTGIIAVFGSSLPEFLRQRLAPALYVPVRIAVCVFAGMLTWIIYQWFFLQLPLIPTWASFFGGIAIAFGFIINILLRPSSYAVFVLTFVAFFAAIYLLNPHTGILEQIGLQEPLINFDSVRQVYIIGIPMAFLYAIGTNGQILWQTLYGQNKVTTYLERNISKLADHTRVSSQSNT